MWRRTGNSASSRARSRIFARTAIVSRSPRRRAVQHYYASARQRLLPRVGLGWRADYRGQTRSHFAHRRSYPEGRSSRLTQRGAGFPPQSMLDLHCHILPGVDDGPASLDGALALARMLAADGITHVTATPHCHRHIRMLRADVLPHVERFNVQLKKEAIALSVLPGSEIQLIDTADYRRHFEAGLYCHLGDGHEFTLLELNWKPDRYPPDAPELIAWLKERGMTPIL